MDCQLRNCFTRAERACRLWRIISPPACMDLVRFCDVDQFSLMCPVLAKRRMVFIPGTALRAMAQALVHHHRGVTHVESPDAF
jgi:hypothetical protein